MGELSANPFGLNDIHGNVNEWVQDAWLPDSYSELRDTTAINRVGRLKIFPTGYTEAATAKILQPLAGFLCAAIMTDLERILLLDFARL